MIAIINKKKPNNLLILFLSILWTVLAPILAMKVVIGIKIKKAGMFKKPMLKGKSSSEWREYATKCMVEIMDNKT